MTDRTRTIAALAAASAIVVACFSERSDAAGPTDGELCDSNAANLVKIRNFAFSPAQLRAAPGTTVTWVNCDDDQHSSTSDAPRWNSGFLSRNATFQHAFTTAGTFPYHCEPHPSMRASVIVE